MTVTKQEAQTQLGSLAKEITGLEVAIRTWGEKSKLAEEKGDDAEVNRLKIETASATRTISSAKEQMAYYSGFAQTRQKRAQKR